jgi:hypothetical protein
MESKILLKLDSDLKIKSKNRAKQEGRNLSTHLRELMKEDVKLLDKYTSFSGNVPDRC